MRGPRARAEARRRCSASPAPARRSRWRTSSSSWQRPTLVLAPNRTLAAQLCSEFKEFFPENAVEYFVSYYDYYQPEAYIPRTDTYIAKDADINEEIDKLRHAATRALFERKDVIIVASVSLHLRSRRAGGVPELRPELQEGRSASPRARVMRRLVDMQYERNDNNLVRGKFRLRGDTPDHPAGLRRAGGAHRLLRRRGRAHHRDRPADRRAAGRARRDRHLSRRSTSSRRRTSSSRRSTTSRRSCEERLAELREAGQDPRSGAARRAHALRHRERCARRATAPASRTTPATSPAAAPGSTPWTLLDYFPDEWLLFIDESHIAIPQVRGMFHGDRRAQDRRWSTTASACRRRWTTAR